MTLPLLVTVSLIAALFARLAPRFDGLLVWVVGVTLAGCAGLVTQGFDYDEYVVIIDATRQLSDQSFALRLVSAKDPIFLFIIELAGALTDDVQFVFLIVAVLAALTKVLATAALPGKRTLFMAIYAIFIAPGLEFAAIRAGLAIGLVMLGYMVARRARWRAVWIALGVASHASVAIIVASRVWPRWWRAILFGTLVLGPVAVPALAGLLEGDARYFQYLDNAGTPFAFLTPASTLLTLLLLSRSGRGRVPAHGPVLSKETLSASYFLVAISLLLTLPIVTAATRVIELAWVFMLAQFLVRDRLMPRRLQMYQAASWCALIGVLTLSNLLRGTWAILL